MVIWRLSPSSWLQWYEEDEEIELEADELDEIGYEGFGVVEQDMYPPAPGVPFQIAKRTRDYLRNIGLG